MSIGQGWARPHPATRLPFRALNRALAPVGTARQPVLVTGHGRSGTTWIGHTLARAPGVLYYDEPCNPDRVGGDAATWFRHVPAGGHDAFFAQHLDAAFRGLVGPGAGTWLKRRGYRRLLPGYQVVVKDVASCLALGWIARRYRPCIVVAVRHPCAVVLSERAKATPTREAIGHLLAQPALVEQHLAPYLPALRAARTPLEVYGAVWGARNRVIADLLARHPEWTVLRYEELCREPRRRFRELYDRLALRWGRSVEAYVRKTTTRERTGTYTVGRLSHAHVDRWRRQMSPDEIRCVRDVVRPFGLPFYDADADWAEAPPEDGP